MSLSKTLYPRLVLIQLGKTCPDMTEKLMTGTLRINLKTKINPFKPEICKWILKQIVKIQMKCCIKWHFIRVCIVKMKAIRVCTGSYSKCSKIS